jgi:hypothetical protein
MSLYQNGGHTVKWRPTPEVSPKPASKPRRPKLVGTVHAKGWTNEARAYRAQLKALYPRIPSRVPKGGSEAVALEIIDNLHLLNARGLYFVRFHFAETVKLCCHR